MPGAGYLTCPNCGSDKFFVDNQADGFVFFHVDLAGCFLTTKTPPHEIGIRDASDIYCISCGWHGGVDELVETA